MDDVYSAKSFILFWGIQHSYPLCKVLFVEGCFNSTAGSAICSVALGIVLASEPLVQGHTLPGVCIQWPILLQP
jgi:hypothetical protein